MGAVIVKEHIYDAFMQGAESAIELFHGYTYSGHPLACAAALATLEAYAEENLFARSGELASYWEQAVHSLKGLPHVIDIRNLGLVAGIELAAIADQPGAQAFQCFLECYRRGVLIRTTGDTIALSPPLMIETRQIEEIISTLHGIISGLD